MKNQLKNKHHIYTKFTLINFSDLEHPTLDFLAEEYSQEIFDRVSL